VCYSYSGARAGVFLVRVCDVLVLQVVHATCALEYNFQVVLSLWQPLYSMVYTLTLLQTPHVSSQVNHSVGPSRSVLAILSNTLSAIDAPEYVDYRLPLTRCFVGVEPSFDSYLLCYLTNGSLRILFTLTENLQ